ncbi:DNA polymerase-3 subunit gamma/tau [Parabacteroides sp. PFB2-10]|uniref:DNA polymerase III subunit gamma/tau n=1 Tax=Parabacteroides sp. PFB2-10 TaxID=1742405 RepID=UPI002476FEF5|nr:DNA polymerase III subunit gamma/tau [Parabacteroides sp. PFB2-10]MDH6311318.1 DNA polymerase-3 subunit gamma/tau [Parabacteroides sp. PFB2-10]MDL2244700.1 DNA polymerase III subunit gamma/tau [Parabacteroides sp. OttesenSCG-928-J18]
MDNYIVSARKYRPSTFQSVVGQKTLTVTLKNAIQNNKLAHAYLFCGPRGVGKTSCARIFAKTINCLSPTSDGESCNTCESCQAFNEQRSYNIHELDAASNNSVDDIRSLIEQVRIPPAIGRYKVFIIDEVHMLSSAAFNAFLKTLEEPPHHALFILATTEKHKVLPTILSRCQVYDFSRITIADIVEHLQYVTTSEGATAEPEALNVIAQKADGGLRDALSIFDQVLSFTNGNITYQAVIDNLNVLDYEYYFRLTDYILTANVRGAILLLNEILGKGFEGQNIISGMANHFRDLLVCKDEATLVLFEVGASIRQRYIEMARRCPDSLLFKAIELSNQCDLNYRTSRNKRLLLELTLIQLCQLTTPAGSDTEDKKKTLIQPIEVEAAPAAQSTPEPTRQPETKTVTTQVPVDTAPVISAPPTTGTPAAAGKSSRPVSTSFKNLTGEKPEEKQQQAEAVVEEINPFNEEDLLKYWLDYAEQLQEKVYLKNAMINCKPVLGENDQFEVKVHNQGQQDELLNAAVPILSYLRQMLRNTHIQMRVAISETNEKKLAYTSTEKYQHLLEVNPLLGKLKDEFNLTID